MPIANYPLDLSQNPHCTGTFSLHIKKLLRDGLISSVIVQEPYLATPNIIRAKQNSCCMSGNKGFLSHHQGLDPEPSIPH